MEEFRTTEKRLGLELEVIRHRKVIDVNTAAKLSGFSRQHIYDIITRKELPVLEHKPKVMISWNQFLRWYAKIPLIPDSPIGKSSYSLRGLMKYTGMGRSWILKMADRQQLPNYFIFKTRRYYKIEAEKAWKEERIYLKEFVTEFEAMKAYHITRKILYLMVGKHLVRCIYDQNLKLYNNRDIKFTLKESAYVQSKIEI